MLVPLAGLLVRAPWRGLPKILADSELLDALRLSLVCASAPTAVSLVCGMPSACALARSQARGIPVLRAPVTLPLARPPVLGVAARLLALCRQLLPVP